MKEMEVKQSKKTGTRLAALRMSERLLGQIRQQLCVQRTLTKKKFSRDEFIEQAIQEKLERDEKKSLTDLDPARRISFRLDLELAEKVEHMVAIERSLGVSSSRSDWIVEAIKEKVELNPQADVSLGSLPTK